MKIVHVSDLHFTARWFEWLIHAAPPGDALCISGDLLDRDNPLAPEAQVEHLHAWLRRIDRPVVVCSGDHDLEWDVRHACWRKARWLERPSADHVHGDGAVVELHGVRVHAVPHTTYPKGVPADVWVVHAPPAGLAVAREYAGTDYGDPSLHESIARHAPRLVLSGRVHEPASWFERRDGVMYLNPGCIRTARFPSHIVIDTVTNEARRVIDSALGAYSETARWGAWFDDAVAPLAIA